MGRASGPPPPIAENGVYSASTTSSRSSTTAVGHNGNGIGLGGSLRGSGESGSADVNKTLPRPSLEGDREVQGTVRRVVVPLARREPSYEDDEYDDEERLQEEQPQDPHLEDAILPTMLDSVIMPAIASVRPFSFPPCTRRHAQGPIWFRCSPVWRPPRRDWHLLTCKGLS